VPALPAGSSPPPPFPPLAPVTANAADADNDPSGSAFVPRAPDMTPPAGTAGKRGAWRPRVLRTALIATGVLLAVLAAVVAWLRFAFDPNAWKPQLIELVEQRYQRTLTLDGDIGLTFFPSIGAQLGPVSLSEADRKTEFAGADRVRVAVSLLPLLRGQVVVDEVVLVKPRATLIEHKDGSRNIDDLVAAGNAGAAPESTTPAAPATSGAGQPLRVDVSKIVIDAGSFVARNEREGSEFKVSSIALTTGRVGGSRADAFTLDANLQAAPSGLELRVQAKGAMLADLEASRFGAGGLVVTASGRAAGAPVDVRVELAQLIIAVQSLQIDKLRATLRHAAPAALTTVEVNLPSLVTRDRVFTGASLGVVIDRKAGADALNVRMGAPLQGRLADAGLGIARVEAPEIKADVEGKVDGKTVQGTARAQFVADVVASRYELPRLALKATLFGLDAPVRDVALALNASAAFNGGAQGTLSVNLDGRVNDSTLRAKIARAGATAAIAFDAEVDQFDLDRYRTPREKTAAGDPGKAAKGAGPADRPIDFGFLRGLELAGALRAGALKVNEIRLNNVRIEVKASGGRLDLAPIAASLYSGRLDGAVTLTDAKPPRIALKQALTGVQVGPLLADAARLNRIEGRGDVRLDLSMQGTSVAAFKRALAGTASLSLADGALRGVDIVAVLREARTRLAQVRGHEVQQSADNARTEFAELKASFAIKDGVARSNDLSMKSPLLRAGGEGAIDIGNDTLDYLLRPTIVGSLAVPGGRDAVDLRGVTVPVRVSGPLVRPQFDFDLQAMLIGSAKQALQQRATDLLQERLGGGKPAADGARPGAGDLLKGILGR
jgi:AsmA protein